ncbi:MAG TPA: hypothetical protein VGR28_01480, partial [Candidatus Thermoplasmatota archaeon]|nr:hypothetical protein [Candidatus Thermoplasmatota archaeon]
GLGKAAAVQTAGKKLAKPSPKPPAEPTPVAAVAGGEGSSAAPEAAASAAPKKKAAAAKAASPKSGQTE